MKNGKISFINGDIYKGDSVNGLMEGKGIYTYKNGDIFQGEFSKGQKKYGELIFNGGNSKYEGFFENDKFCGEGILLNDINNNEEQKGVFKNGILVENRDNIELDKNNIILSDDINIEIKQKNGWEIASINKYKYRHKQVYIKKGTKKEEKVEEKVEEKEEDMENKNEINEIKIEEKKENEIKNDLSNKDQNKNEIEIKINNE